MSKILLLIVLIAGEKEFLNGIVAVVNNRVITFRDVQIMKGLKHLEGIELDDKGALNMLIEEAIVLQGAEEQGIEAGEKDIQECELKIEKLIEKIGENEMLKQEGLNHKDIYSYCLKIETMSLFIQNKFIKPLMINTKGATEEDLKYLQSDAENNYKQWLSEVLRKSRIETFISGERL
jgi:hypothetical protein